jgi:glycosyltransferase involved in cell wall biosynthesis
MVTPHPDAGGSAVSVSVVIPAYNAGRYLAEAVASALEQTRSPAEVIVVDDGSTDDTAAVAEGFGPTVRLVRQANVGPAAAMNAGTVLATGTHLAFLSADDRWAPNKLELQLARLDDDPTLDLVFGHVAHFLSPDLDPEVASGLHCPDHPMPAKSAGTMLIRRATFDRVGPFETSFRTGEFFDWFARATDLGLRHEVLPEVVSHRRVHRTNHSRVERAPQTGYAKVLKAMIDRRRAQDGNGSTA